MLTQMLHDDFVWSAISGAVHSGKRRMGSSIQMNCPLCVKRGHRRPDRRERLGIKKNPNGIEFNCFNCAAKGKFELGSMISESVRELMEGLGISSMEIKRLNHKALQYRRMLTINSETQDVPLISKPNFPTISMPKGARTIAEWAAEDTADLNFLQVAEYMFSRGDVIANPSSFYWTPDTLNSLNRRLLIPLHHNGRIVGWTGRLIDKADPNKGLSKYFAETPANYIYNSDALDGEGKFVIVQEGPLDAIATDGVALMGAKLSDEQAYWLNSSHKVKIVIADRDQSGQRLIDHALKHNWMVSFPKLAEGHGDNNWWETDIKDPAAASARYGKLYTLISIIESATQNKIEINVKRKLLV